MDENQRKLILAQAHLMMKQSLVTYWTTFATSEANKSRTVVRGDGHQLTAKELESDAFNTALTHIHGMMETYDYMCELKTVIHESF